MRSDRRTARLFPGFAAALWLAASACGDGGPPPLFGDAPAPVPTLLVDAEPTVTGMPPDHPTDGAHLASFSGDALRAWARDTTESAVRFTSPSFGPRGLAGAGTLRVRLQPGGATRVVVVPHAHGGQLQREHRVLRSVELGLERDAAGEQPVALEVDLYEALHGNFGDAGRAGSLAKIELLLPGASEDEARLLGVAIAARRELASDTAAGATLADRGGVLRPAFFVRGGATASFRVAVPRGAPELRWHDAALPGSGDRVVEVRDGGETFPLSRLPAATDEETDEEGAPWRAQTSPLARFAGRTVELLLRTEGRGAGLFGEPRILVPEASPGPKSPPDVLVYLIDTLRADRLGAGGNPAPGVSPVLDRLAREGAWFELALSSSPWTKPAIATLMTGILPTTHGVGASTYTDRMPKGVPLVQERFRAAGWRTGSFSASPLGSTLSALERGFSAAYPPRFWGPRAELAMNPSAGQLGEALLAWVDERPDEPFFAYVHTLEVHEWKLPRYQRDLPPGLTSYDAAIVDADRHLGLLLANLERRERGRDLLVVVVSDHGESWGDHGMPSHGFGLFQSQIHIPLIFWSSKGRLEPRRVDAPVSLADLAPTLVAGFGLPALEGAWGRSLTGYLAGRPPADRPVLSSLLRFVWAPRAPRQYAVTTPERVKLIRREQREGGAADQVFDLTGDPGETRPLPAGPARAGETLERMLAEQQERAHAFRERFGDLVPGAVTPDDTERLRALGYLEEHLEEPLEEHLEGD